MNKAKIAGWIAVSISTILTSFWAFWGITENFHEGWYFDSLVFNLGLMVVQYLSFMFVFMAVTLISIFRSHIGGGLHFLAALFAVWLFRSFSNAATFLIIIPLVGLGLLYWFGRPNPRKTAVTLALSVPVLVLVISSIQPIMRVSQRLDDGDLDSRRVYGNGVILIWAPEGPGWPREGVNWQEAGQACRYLNEDGLSLASEPQAIWRLPTVDEAVRSMALHGKNSGGTWDALTGEASYITTPDKESPLWNVHSQIIYWWTATDIDDAWAYIIVYDGKVWPRAKQFGPAYLGFRCVRED